MISKLLFSFGGTNPFTNEGCLIELYQFDNSTLLFGVTYGLQVKEGLTYSQASKELGECIFHHLACESLLDNTGL